MAPRWSDVEQLRLCFGPKLGRNRADKSWVEPKLFKDRTDFTKGDRRFVQLHVNNVVVSIHLVTQSRDGFELVIQFQDFIQVAQTSRVYFQFDHRAKFTGRRKRCNALTACPER